MPPTIIQCCSNFCCIVTPYFILNCWLILPSCCKAHRKMLVFDRLSLFPLTLVLLYCSPLYSLPFHFDTIAYCLECVGLSLAEYATYSPLLYFPLYVLPDRPLQSTLEPRSRSTPAEPTTTSSTPLTRSSFGGSWAGGLTLSICISDVICASLL